MKKPVANPHAAVAQFSAMTRSFAEPAARSRRMRAFTLIEMLVVIAIIGILAALVVGVLPGITAKRTRSVVLTQMTAIQTAINTYKQKQGFYPPDNPADSSRSQLFYELTGTEFDPSKTPPEHKDFLGNVITTNTLGTYFGVAGIVNAATKGSSETKQNYFETIKPNAYGTLPNSTPEVKVLLVPAKGPNGEPNFWHYNSSRPTHNADSYDLWAEVMVGGQTNIIGNWK